MMMHRNTAGVGRSYSSPCINPSSNVDVRVPRQTPIQTQTDSFLSTKKDSIPQPQSTQSLPALEGKSKTLKHEHKHTSTSTMCEKGILIWTCGCTQLEDPRPCPKARHRNKPCDGYGFVWAYRDPIPYHTHSKCPTCLHNDEIALRRRANEALLVNSHAYPTLQSVANGDDSQRVRTGRPRYDRTASGTEIYVPEGWVPEMNRLPGNANEYSAFLTGSFDPLLRLPDTHIPPPTDRTQPPPILSARPQQLQGQQRLRLHAPPQFWQGPVVLEDAEYPYVEFKGALGAQRPGMAGRRTSYTGRVAEKGWAPPRSGTLPPQSDVDTEPPSRMHSPQLKVTPPQK